MKCLICNVPLTAGEQHGVKIHFCSKCQGVWLDWGKLNTIIKRASIKISARPYPERSAVCHDHHENHKGSHHKKKREFLH